MKLSIITTIYKAEKDLPRLLDSMMQQKSPELEFFLIDNGSPDRCGEIAAEYAKRDSRFTIYTIKDNIGYIRARNEGIRVCTGDYIGFCDSDDFLVPEAYDRAIEKIHETNCDLYITSYHTISGDVILENKLPYNEGLYDKKSIVEAILPNTFGPFNGKPALYGFMWKQIFRHSLILDNRILFDDTLKPCEDEIFNIDVIKLCKSIFICDNPIYNYVVNSESITARLASSFNFVNEYRFARKIYDEKQRRLTNTNEAQALSSRLLGSLYSMFLNEAKLINKSLYQSLSDIDSVYDDAWIQDVLHKSVAPTIRLKVVRFLLIHGLYNLLLFLMKLVNKK